MRTLLLIVLVFFAVGRANAQEMEQDLDRIAEWVHKKNEPPVTDKGGFFHGILKIYSNHLSEQIINDCIYSPSCSTFSQGAIREYGIIKGFFLSIDRLTRCNNASRLQIAPVRVNSEGKVNDHWEDYTFRN